MNRNDNNNGEEGFALVMTIIILLGLLAIVTPLVMINNRKTIELGHLETEMKADFAMKSAKNMVSHVNRLSGVSKPIFYRRSLLPGWQDIPLILVAAQSSGAQIKVKNILPAFLQSCSEGNSTGHAWTIKGAELSKHGVFISGVKGGYGVDPIPYGVEAGEVGFLKINGEWLSVTDLNCSNTAGDLSGAFSIAGGVHLEIEDGEMIEFYPVKPFHGPKKDDVHMNIQIIDEYSKININSIPFNLRSVLNLTGVSHYYPLETMDSLKGTFALNSTQMTQLSSMITPYSEPDYNVIIYQGSYPTGEFAIPSAKKVARIVDGKINSFGRRKNKIYPHYVNLNTASVATLSKVFQAMGVEEDYCDGLATQVVEYRSGDDKRNHMDGDENPFDGYDSREAGMFYGSAEDEFLHWLKKSEFNGYLKQIKAHMTSNGKLEIFDIGSSISVPIGFESGDVKTVIATVGVKKNANTPPIFKKSKYVYKDIKGFGSDESIILSSEHGWNKAGSHFLNVDWRQPTFFNVDDKTAEIDVNLTGTFGPYLKGRVMDSTYTVEGIKPPLEDSFMPIIEFDSPLENLADGGTLDFGLRPATINGWHNVIRTAEDGNRRRSKNNSFYYTTFHKKGAQWKSIEWDGVDVKIKAKVNDVEVDINDINQEGVLFIEVDFNGEDDSDEHEQGNDTIIPQLYKLKINYKLAAGASPKVVYDYQQ